MSKGRPNGVVIWRGPSRIDGKPIRAILHGIYNPVSNPKTGPGDQLAILPDGTSGWPDTYAASESVCGDCPLYGEKRTCYVNPMYVNKISKQPYPNGNFADLPAPNGLHRMGSWGDPAALPLEVLAQLAKRARNWTGYTRRWPVLGENPPEAQYLMASVLTPQEAVRAQELGWRCYFTSLPDELLLKGFAWCPNHTRGLTCLECKLCDGNNRRAKSIQNPVHGTGKDRMLVQIRERL